ncbi:hypothetical protein D0Z08_19785 [Nocardioides immobilis]|uniref:Carboxypeptidase regulatory-like domain-containing protein n=1 Tax=Nocardioides immobilis TaxID=2049295 RepID=A0A417XYN5_9ACTN|nr:hypothetical protein [Nocardioides immobilis]RHW25465.1 hypothetical protein D0Z08_19785 [Nocardioides immobilis]
MRRVVSLFVLAVLAALFNVVAPPSATAGAVITGQVVQYGGDPVPGTTVRLYQDAGGAPGALVDTVTTDATGNFTLSPSLDIPHWVEVVRNSRIQGGYVKDHTTGPSYVVFDISQADPVEPGTSLGRVLAAPSFISGVVVNAATGNRLRGIAVSVREIDALGVSVGNDTTDANGFFRIPVFGEEFGVKVKGGARGFENGWVGCARDVVPTWGAACSHAPGRIGRIQLDRL